MKLFKSHGWEIRAAGVENIPKIKIIATHTDCKRSVTSVSWFVAEINPICWSCKEPVPDVIQTLIYLHDGIQ